MMDLSDQPVIDPRTLAALRDLGEDLLEEIVAIFLADAPKRITEITSAVRRGDATAMWKAAHELRSVASNAGAMRLAHLCDLIQEQGVAGSVEGMDPIVRQLRTECDGAATELLAM